MSAAGFMLIAFGELVILGLILFLAAGTFAWTAAWLYLGVIAAASALIVPWVYKYSPGLFRERLTYFRPDQKAWDKVFVVVAGIVMLAWTAVMPLDAVRFRWSHIPVWLRGIGLVLLLLDWYLIFAVFKANPYLASTVRVQEERGQTVVSSGPYRYVRHPLYSALFLYVLATGLMLGSWIGVLFEVLFIPTFTVRAVLEERQLRAELKGYGEYLQEVRYRFIPAVL